MTGMLFSARNCCATSDVESSADLPHLQCSANLPTLKADMSKSSKIFSTNLMLSYISLPVNELQERFYITMTQIVLSMPNGCEYFTYIFLCALLYRYIKFAYK
jgi:hypothetical protein